MESVGRDTVENRASSVTRWVVVGLVAAALVALALAVGDSLSIGGGLGEEEGRSPAEGDPPPLLGHGDENADEDAADVGDSGNQVSVRLVSESGDPVSGVSITFSPYDARVDPFTGRSSAAGEIPLPSALRGQYLVASLTDGGNDWAGTIPSVFGVTGRHDLTLTSGCSVVCDDVPIGARHVTFMHDGTVRTVRVPDGATSVELGRFHAGELRLLAASGLPASRRGQKWAIPADGSARVAFRRAETAKFATIEIVAPRSAQRMSVYLRTESRVPELDFEGMQIVDGVVTLRVPPGSYDVVCVSGDRCGVDSAVADAARALTLRPSWTEVSWVDVDVPRGREIELIEAWCVPGSWAKWDRNPRHDPRRVAVAEGVVSLGARFSPPPGTPRLASFDPPGDHARVPRLPGSTLMIRVSTDDGAQYFHVLTPSEKGSVAARAVARHDVAIEGAAPIPERMTVVVRSVEPDGSPGRVLGRGTAVAGRVIVLASEGEVPFILVSTAGARRGSALVEGGDEPAIVRLMRGDEVRLGVAVVDRDDNPVPGVPVSFIPDGGGAPVVAIADGQGVASVWMAPSRAILAEVAGLRFRSDPVTLGDDGRGRLVAVETGALRFLNKSGRLLDGTFEVWSGERRVKRSTVALLERSTLAFSALAPGHYRVVFRERKGGPSVDGFAVDRAVAVDAGAETEVEIR